MKKSDYYILKTSSPRVCENDSDDSSSSLLDLDNNEFNFTSLKVRSPQDQHTTNFSMNIPIKGKSPYLVGGSGSQSPSDYP